MAGLWDGGWLGTEQDLGVAAGPGQSRTGWWLSTEQNPPLLRIEQDPGIAQTRAGREYGCSRTEEDRGVAQTSTGPGEWLSQDRRGPGDGSDQNRTRGMAVSGQKRTGGWLRTEQDPGGGCPGAAGGGTPGPPCPRVTRAPRRAGRARTGIGWRCYGTLYFKEVAVTMAHSNNSAATSPGGRHRMLSRHMISFLLNSALTADISHKCLLYYLPVIVFCAGNGPRNPRPNASRVLRCLPVNLSMSGAPGGPASTWASSVTALWDAFVQVPRRAGPAAGTGRSSVPLFAKSVICHFSRGWVFKAVSSG